MLKNTQYTILLFLSIFVMILLPCISFSQEGTFIMSYTSINKTSKPENLIDKNLYDFVHMGLLEEVEKSIKFERANLKKLNILGTIYINFGEYSKADKLYLSLSSLVKDGEGDGIRNNSAILYYKQGQYEHSLSILSELLNENENEKAIYNNNIGVIYAEKRDFGQAKNYFNDIIKSAEKNEIYNLDIVYNNIGEVLRREGKLTEAIKYFKDALFISNENNNLITKAQILNNIATVNYLRGNYKEAVIDFNKSVDLNGKVLNMGELAKNYSNLGYTFLLKEDYDKALMYFKKELTINEKLNHKTKISLSYNKIGMVKFHQEKYPEAIKLYKKAIDNYSDVSLSDENIADFYINLSLVYQKVGRYEPAIESMETGVDIQKEINSSYYERNKKLLEELITIYNETKKK